MVNNCEKNFQGQICVVPTSRPPGSVHALIQQVAHQCGRLGSSMRERWTPLWFLESLSYTSPAILLTLGALCPDPSIGWGRVGRHLAGGKTHHFLRQGAGRRDPRVETAHACRQAARNRLTQHRRPGEEQEQNSNSTLPWGVQEGLRKLEGAWHSEPMWTATQHWMGVGTAEQRQCGKMCEPPEP